MTATPARLPRLLLAVFVLLAATSVGGFFGWVAGSMYVEKPGHAWLQPLGMAVGLAGGCITASLWLIVVFNKMSKARPLLVVFIGAGLGTVAGVLTTVFVHAALIAVTHRGLAVFDAAICVALAGAPAGFLVGLVCGYAAGWVAAWSRRHE